MRYFIFLLTILYSTAAYAGPGHDHGESAFAGGGAAADHFDLTEDQIKNLNIQSAKVSLLPVAETVDMLAFTELLPEKQFHVTPRFESRVGDVFVKIGQKVNKGQPLVRLEPLIVGNPPIIQKAQIDGIVLEQNTVPGQIVSAGDVLMLIGDNSEILVRGVAYESPIIEKLEVGQHVDVHLDIAPEQHLHGELQRLDLRIDPKKRTFAVYAHIPNPPKNIQPNLQGVMEIQISQKNKVLTVPKKALLGELGAYFVYTKNGLQVEKKDVVTGKNNAGHIEIKSGLKLEDSVVTHGNYQLQYVAMGAVQDHSEGGHDDHEGHDHSEGKHDNHEGHDHNKDSHDDHKGHDHGEDKHDDHEGHDHSKDNHDDHKGESQNEIEQNDHKGHDHHDH